jgi:MFS family permease
MQFTAMGFFVARMAGSAHQAALDLGILGASRAIPVLLLSPIAGVVADRLQRRRVLLVTNTTMALAALILALLASAHALNLLSLALISALNSGANGFDAPTRQSWVPLLVDRRYIGNAVGLNSIAFNAPAVVGPAFAGLLIVWIGVAGAFYFNAGATLAVVVAVILMKPSPPSAHQAEPTWHAMKQGVSFIVAAPGAAVDRAGAVRHRDPDATVLATHRRFCGQRLARRARAAWAGPSRRSASADSAERSSRRISRSESAALRLWLQAGLLMSAGVFVLAFVPSLRLAVGVLFAIGVGTMAMMGATSTLIQILSPDDVRGRALSIYTMIAIGVMPLGSLVDGAIGSVIGLRETFALAGALCIALFLGIWLFAPIVRTV